MAKSIPDGYHSVTVSFTFKNCVKAIEFYKKAFGATTIDILPGPDGKSTMHAVMKIGNTIMMMGDEGSHCKSAETLGDSPISLYLYVDNADAVFKQALSAGAKEKMPVMDMFWGDRAGTLTDPFGYQWMVATHKSDPTKEQIQKGAQEFFASMSAKGHK